MKKVIYSITRLGKVENTKMTGVGYITEDELTLSGMVTLVKPLQPANTRSPIEVTPSGMTILVKLSQE